MCKEDNTSKYPATFGNFVNIDLKDRNDIPITPPEKPSWFKKIILKSSSGYTNRQLKICIIFGLVEFFAACIISIQAPFFPYVAGVKGATPIEYGFVFGIFELTVFIMSPIFGAKINSWDPKRMFSYGILITGSCCIIFGCLNLLENRVAFIASCLIVRVVEAVGDAAFVVASFTIIAMEFPDSICTTFGRMETMYGLGLIGGPTIGGALYEIGGYTLPFSTMGALLLLSAFATFYVLPDLNATQEKVTTSSLATFRLLKHPSIFIIGYSIVAATSGVGFLHATLEPQIEITQPGLSKLLVGAVFILNGGIYAITAPSWGKLCDKLEQPKIFTLLGALFNIAGFICIAPILPIHTSLWNICIGLALFGLGLGSTLVSAFILILQDAVALGYPDDVGSYGLVSGLWTSMTALGFFIGSVAGGILLSFVGFQLGMLFVLGAQIILVFMLAIHHYKCGVGTSGKFDTRNGSRDPLPGLDTCGFKL